MNPPGGVTSDSMCGCPNVLADDAFGTANGGDCTMLPGYQSVYDPLGAVHGPVIPAPIAPAVVEAETVAKGATCYNNTNTPNVTQYGPYPIEAGVVAGQVGEQGGALPTLEELQGNLESIMTGLRGILGMNPDGSDELRRRWNAARGVTGAQVSDETEFQMWLDGVKSRYNQYRAQRQAPAKAVLGGVVGEAGSWTRTLVWILILVAIGALIYMNRKKIMSWLPLGKKSTAAPSAENLVVDTPLVTGSVLRARRRQRRHRM